MCLSLLHLNPTRLGGGLQSAPIPAQGLLCNYLRTASAPAHNELCMLGAAMQPLAHLQME